MTFDAASLNPQGVVDSMVASCQKNFTLLTTDGYWTDVNSAYDGAVNTGWKVDGTTRMDNEDVGPTTTTPRPFYEGPTASTGTLADVAMYYYKNDLRPPVMVGSPAQDIWEDNVKPVGTDTALWQHMTTYTLGLGLDGVLDYQSDYDSTPPPAGDYADIMSGAKNWTPVTTTGNDESALDDLWHAAVNGRGKFFSARDPNALTAGLSEALGNINGASGAGAAAATSNLQPVAGDNWAFTPEYKSEPFQTDRQSLAWHGDVKAKTIDLVGGIVSSFVLWSAQSLLDSKAQSSRSIYTFTSDTANFPSKVKTLTWNRVPGGHQSHDRGAGVFQPGAAVDVERMDRHAGIGEHHHRQVAGRLCSRGHDVQGHRKQPRHGPLPRPPPHPGRCGLGAAGLHQGTAVRLYRQRLYDLQVEPGRAARDAVRRRERRHAARL
jgi:type IV pilus assembly protein PilY1